jgi:pSer/pThr/pTyr-binding forkhead associated (FHA) protein
MSVCTVCRKDNLPQYKFCLGCGAELEGLPAKKSAGNAPSVESMTVVDAPLFEDGAPTNGAAPTETAAAPRSCPACNRDVPAKFKFCPSCGAPVESKVTAPHKVPTTQAPVSGRMVVVRPDGTEGGSYALSDGENRIGRSTGALFEADGYLSPVHAELVLNAAGLVVHDSNSLNGVYVKLSGSEELHDGDVFRIGQELLRFDVIPRPQPLEDGTEILGSPNPGYWGRLAVIVGRDQDGSAFPLLGDTILLGRERGDITFPEDGYVSGSHARVESRDGRFYLSDLGSSNGTFVRIRGERAVPSGSLVLMGQQLFRISY